MFLVQKPRRRRCEPFHLPRPCDSVSLVGLTDYQKTYLWVLMAAINEGSRVYGLSQISVRMTHVSLTMILVAYSCF